MWSYPRPPDLVPDSREVVVRWDDVEVVRTTGAWRVLETAHPPGWYLPSQDVTPDLLHPATGSSVCEWKGRAVYWDLVDGDRRLERVAWSYPSPTRRFSPIAGYVAFYPTHLTCTVDGEVVVPEEGGFYGGWITPDVVGPFKGAPGTWGW